MSSCHRQHCRECTTLSVREIFCCSLNWTVTSESLWSVHLTVHSLKFHHKVVAILPWRVADIRRFLTRLHCTFVGASESDHRRLAPMQMTEQEWMLCIANGRLWLSIDWWEFYWHDTSMTFSENQIRSIKAHLRNIQAQKTIAIDATLCELCKQMFFRLAVDALLWVKNDTKTTKSSSRTDLRVC